MTVGNQFTCPVSNLNLYVVPISSGFFETIKGSSRIIKGVLTEQDILSSAAHAPDADLQRMVGMGEQRGNMVTDSQPFGPGAFGKSAKAGVKSRMASYM